MVAEELTAACRGQIATYKIPRYWKLVDAVPDDDHRQGAEVRHARDGRGGAGGRLTGWAPMGRPSCTHTGELAAGVARLGTETAFSVLARARAMEHAGRDVIHLEIGEPDFDTPAHITEAGDRRAARGGDALLPRGRHPRAARGGGRRAHRARAACDIAPERVLVANGRQAVPVLHHPRDVRAGRRGHLSRPRLPDLRVGHPLGRRDAGPAAAARGARASASRSRTSRRA